MKINNVNKMIICIANDSKRDITIGHMYEVYNESKEYYLITDDKFDKHLYPKTLFRVIEYSSFEVAYNNYEELLEEVAIA